MNLAFVDKTLKSIEISSLKSFIYKANIKKKLIKFLNK